METNALSHLCLFFCVKNEKVLTELYVKSTRKRAKSYCYPWKREARKLFTWGNYSSGKVVRYTGKEWMGCPSAKVLKCYDLQHKKWQTWGETWKGYISVQQERPFAAPVAAVPRTEWRKGQCNTKRTTTVLYRIYFFFPSPINELIYVHFGLAQNTLLEFRGSEISVEPTTERKGSKWRSTGLRSGPLLWAKATTCNHIAWWSQLHPVSCSSAPKQGVFLQTSLSAPVLALTLCSLWLIPTSHHSLICARKTAGMGTGWSVLRKITPLEKRGERELD